MSSEQPPKNGRPTRRRHKTHRKVNKLRLFILVVIFTALAGFGTAAGLVLYSVQDMPAWDPVALEPNLPSYIFDKDENQVAKIFVENRVPVPLEEVPKDIQNAFLATEDIRFYEHMGLDIRRIAGAFLADIKAGRAEQGASTITQQLIKRAFLSPEKTLKRKIQEAALAIQLERRFTKDEIFEMYLNQIYFGEGAYGIKSAAQVYYGRELEKLTLDQAALLAALPKAPNTYNPYKNMEAAQKRRNIVLNNMVRYEFITEEQAEEAKTKEIVLSGTKASDVKKYKYPYFVDYITDILLDRYGEEKVYKDGLKVYTTLDPEIQAIAEAALANEKNFPRGKTDENGIQQPQAAVVVLDPQSGHIKAIVGGRDHTQKRQFNRATDAVRQPGSAFKPVIAYGPAIENGASTVTVVDDSPTKFGSHEFKNYDGQYHGLVTYRTALRKSYNVPAVKVLQDTGITKSIDFAKKLGITTLVTKDHDSKRNDENLSAALGGLTRGVTPLELASAYGTFGNEGVHVEPLAILKVKDRDGNVIDEFKPKKTIAMKKTTAYIITDMLQSVVSSGTGTAASLGSRPVAGKTGTTSDYKDAWFAGYTPELVTVVWMGHDEPQRMSGVTGGSYPARIWREVMSKALKEAPVKKFTKPEGIVSSTVCSKSGLKAGENCPEEELVTDIFVKGTVPSKECDVHVLVEVCAESNQIPTAACPERVTRGFVKGEEPTETCTIHTGTARSSGIAVCTDPRHGGIMYAAIIAGPNNSGGCPEEHIQYIDFPYGEGPTAYCYLPDHQLKPKAPSGPTSPQGVTINAPGKKPKKHN